MSHAARSERPISRWISTVRPLCLPLAASRSIRSGDAPGSIEYSAVTQPLPLPRIQRGTSSSMLAVHSTRVLAERDEHGAVGHLGVVALERDRAQLVGGAAVGSGHGGAPVGAVVREPHGAAGFPVFGCDRARGRAAGRRVRRTSVDVAARQEAVRGRSATSAAQQAEFDRAGRAPRTRSRRPS